MPDDWTTDGYMVQEIESYLRPYRAWWQSAVPNPSWQEMARRVWFKTFSTSGQFKDHPPQPPELASELANMPSPLAAAIHVLASASLAVTHRGNLADEVARYTEHYRRYMETPDGRNRQSYLDSHPIS
jgi:hypothetical protein